MNRSELVKTLGLVRPALSDNNLVDVFRCFAFGKKQVEAYNSNIGISAPCAVNLGRFAVDGKVLLGLLENSAADDVELEVQEDGVKLTAGRSVGQLPYLPEDAIIFERPNKDKPTVEITLNAAFLEALETCQLTACDSETMPAILGTTLVSNKGVTLYSCDGDAITRCCPETEGTGTGAFLMPNAFCSALLALAKQLEQSEGVLHVSSEWAKAELKSGHAVWGRMTVVDVSFDYAEQVKKVLKKEDGFVKLPLGFDAALARAMVVAEAESKQTSLEVEKGKLYLRTEASSGLVDDDLTIRGHADVKALVHASLIRKVIGVCDEITIRENVCAYRKGETTLVIVSNIGE